MAAGLGRCAESGDCLLGFVAALAISVFFSFADGMPWMLDAHTNR